MTSTQTPRDAAIVQVIEGIGGAVAQDPKNAAAVFRAVGAGGDGVRTELRIGRHHAVSDEPPKLGGEDAGPNPVEYALAGLVSCQVVTYRIWAAKLGIPLEDIDITVDGDLDIRGFSGLDDSVRPGFGDIRLVVDLKGPAAPEDYQRLREAVDAHCPVLDLFRNPTPVSTGAPA